MGRFSGIGKASGTGQRGVKFTKGFDGELEVVKATLFKTRTKGDAFIVRFKIVSNVGNPDVDQVGAEREWYQGMQDTDIAFPEILRWLYAVSGMTVDQGEKAFSTEELRETALTAATEENKCAGRRHHAVFYEKETQKNKKLITVPIFSPSTAQQAAAA